MKRIAVLALAVLALADVGCHCFKHGRCDTPAPCPPGGMIAGPPVVPAGPVVNYAPPAPCNPPH
jgi:hypothetical protein